MGLPGSRRNVQKLVDEHYQTRDCATYRDFHELLGRRDIDAVLIATGDRWHAPASNAWRRGVPSAHGSAPCRASSAQRSSKAAPH